eukprot:jgi/Chlat1/52/ChrspC238811S00929
MRLAVPAVWPLVSTHEAYAHRLQGNHVAPFVRLPGRRKGAFTLTYRPAAFYTCVAIVAAAAVAATAFAAAGQADAFLFAACLLVIVACLPLAWGYRLARTVLLEGPSSFLTSASSSSFAAAASSSLLASPKRGSEHHPQGRYTLLVGGQEAASGEWWNVYVQLRAVAGAAPGKKPKYQLTFGGNELETVYLTWGYSDSLEEMRSLGQALAKRLDVNYFDEANISMHHSIRYSNPALSQKAT